MELSVSVKGQKDLTEVFFPAHMVTQPFLSDTVTSKVRGNSWMLYLLFHEWGMTVSYHVCHQLSVTASHSLGSHFGLGGLVWLQRVEFQESSSRDQRP